MQSKPTFVTKRNRVPKMWLCFAKNMVETTFRLDETRWEPHLCVKCRKP